MMAHECPECFTVCYCNGDIDDCLRNFDRDIAACTHCENTDVEITELDDEEDV